MKVDGVSEAAERLNQWYDSHGGKSQFGADVDAALKTLGRLGMQLEGNPELLANISAICEQITKQLGAMHQEATKELTQAVTKTLAEALQPRISKVSPETLATFVEEITTFVGHVNNAIRFLVTHKRAIFTAAISTGTVCAFGPERLYMVLIQMAQFFFSLLNYIWGSYFGSAPNTNIVKETGWFF